MICSRRSSAFLREGASRISITNALKAGHACSGTFCSRFCSLGTQQRIRKDLGHIASIAFVNPRAPSVGIVTGGRTPRLPKSRKTSLQLSSLSLLGVERLTNTLRPPSQIAQIQSPPVFCPQRRNGSYTVSIKR